MRCRAVRPLLRSRRKWTSPMGLPPVLPIVLYNGDARWRQSSELYVI